MLFPERVLSPNQGFVFTQIKEPRIYLLIADLESRVGKMAVSSVEAKSFLGDSLYAINFPKLPTFLDLYYLRKLGVVVIPELREYYDGQVQHVWAGLDRIVEMRSDSYFTYYSCTPTPKYVYRTSVRSS